MKSGAKSPEELCNALKGQLNRQTVFTALASLVKIGLVAKKRVGTINAPRKVMYELAAREEPAWMVAAWWDTLTRKLSPREKRECRKAFETTVKRARGSISVLGCDYYGILCNT